jgi:hypothetical protein
VVSDRGLENETVEYKHRSSEESEQLTVASVVEFIVSQLQS